MLVSEQMNKNKAVLLVATTAYMIRQFNMNNILLLQSLGYEVEVSCNFIKGNPISTDLIHDLKDQLDKLGVVQHQIPIVKQPLNIKANLRTYLFLLELMRRKQYSFVHCQTPVGAVLARIAAHKAHTPCIYMAHGFHFYKGANFLTWLKYYPVEWILSSITNVLILINAEDFKLATTKMKAKKNIFVPGVGINLSCFQEMNTAKVILRRELNIPSDSTILLSVGELNKNKNHEFILRLLPDLFGFHLLIAGEGNLKPRLLEIAKELKVIDRVNFLGYVKDTRSYFRLADIYCHPSLREGLSVAIMEAMATGLPVVCSDIRGNRDLIDHEQGGFLLSPDLAADYIDSFILLSEDSKKRKEMGEYNLKKIKSYDQNNINQLMKKIYVEISDI